MVSLLPGTEGVVEVAVTGVTTALATVACRGTGAVAWTWVSALAGDGTAIWVDTTPMTGAETGARAGVGTGTADGREEVACIGAELVEATVTATWAALTETGANAVAGAVRFIWTGAEVRPGEGLKTCDWTWDWGATCPGTGSAPAVWVGKGNEPWVREETWVWTMAGPSVRFCAGSVSEVKTF